MTALHAAALLIFLLGLAHSVLGERFILVRLFRRDNLPKLFGGTEFTARTLRFAWHITTVAWWGIAVLLWTAASGNPTRTSVLTVLGYTLVLSGILPLALTRGRHLSWLVLFLSGGLVLWCAA
ncbi:hypothetical protein J5837_05350 [Pseudoxanthomonas helianthi]|uniref:Uncharacterized protein n=1 Tax=Pseudoxanthomonas helianthi TaxID=1453541 RepID=A0A941ASV0_9GAMM|nr:hypothetical protein [Pseudoxanthomonas helianthi]MBP3983849.1 hypothetical protein [Pseudoxanthomonas helianthi]